MKKITELPLLAQVAIFLGIAVVLVAGGEYLYLMDMSTQNAEKAKKLDVLKRENEAVKPFEGKLKQIKVDNERASRQLTSMRATLPEEKEADSFIRMMQDAGTGSNVEIRRFTARPVVAREFYMEMPFDLQIGGTYYSVLQFFDKMGKLSRIVNITNLTMTPAPVGAAAGGKTVMANCTATTFFGRGQPPGAKGKKK